MIKVLLCDDQEIVTEGMQMILRSAGGVEVVAMAQDGAQAVDLVALHHPDVVLMDLRMGL